MIKIKEDEYDELLLKNASNLMFYQTFKNEDGSYTGWVV